MQTPDRSGSIIGQMCDHLHDTTTRYDRVEEVLTFLLICPVCRTEQILEKRHYAPSFHPTRDERGDHRAAGPCQVFPRARRARARGARGRPVDRARRDLALLGPNGAGKSTTLEMLLGLTEPDAGTVSIFGASPREAIDAGGIGAMLQIGGLIGDLSVRELSR